MIYYAGLFDVDQINCAIEYYLIDHARRGGDAQLRDILSNYKLLPRTDFSGVIGNEIQGVVFSAV